MKILFPGGFQINRTFLFILVIFLVFFDVEAQVGAGARQPPSSQDDHRANNGSNKFLPNFLIVTGILLTFLFTSVLMLIFCIKCMNLDQPITFYDQNQLDQMIQIRPESRFSGIDKNVIASLPFFTFSSLAGSKQGLACAVCLANYEESETLRLLPKCKHGFHLECIDEWLEKHSTCPLCRVKVSPNDVSSLPNSGSLRFFYSQPDVQNEESSQGLFVEREESFHGSLRFDENLSNDGSWRKEKFLHRFNHRIVVPGAVMNNRWSNVSFNDLMVLNSEMIKDVSSSRFDLESNSGEIEDGDGLGMKKSVFGSKEIIKMKQSDQLFPLPDQKQAAGTSKSKPGSRIFDQADKRSMSEIVVHPRFMELGTKDVVKDSLLQENGVKEDRRKRLWLPIARRTVQWFADRETSSMQSHNRRQPVNI